MAAGCRNSYCRNSTKWEREAEREGEISLYKVRSSLYQYISVKLGKHSVKVNFSPCNMCPRSLRNALNCLVGELP